MSSAEARPESDGLVGGTEEPPLEARSHYDDRERDGRGATLTQPSPEAAELNVGPALRKLRQAHGMTVSMLAREADLSPSAVSQIEAGTILPSLVTLQRLARALNEPTFRLLVDARSRQIVVRRTARKRLVIPGSGARYELVSPDLDGSIEVLHVELAAGAASVASPSRHTGEECLLVLRGIADVEVAGEVHRLRPGDSATFSGDLPHRISNPGKRGLEGILILSPPSF